MTKKGEVHWTQIVLGIVAFSVLILVMVGLLYGQTGPLIGIFGDVTEAAIAKGATLTQIEEENRKDILANPENRRKVRDNIIKKIDDYVGEFDCDLAILEFDEALAEDNPDFSREREEIAEKYPEIAGCFVDDKDCNGAYEFYINNKGNGLIDRTELAQSLFDTGICYKEELDEKNAVDKFEEVVEEFSDLAQLNANANLELEELKKSDLSEEERENLGVAEGEIRQEFLDAFAYYGRGDYVQAKDEFEKIRVKYLRFTNREKSTEINQYLANSIYFKGLASSRLPPATNSQQNRCNALSDTVKPLIEDSLFSNIRIVLGGSQGTILLPIILKETGDCFINVNEPTIAAKFYNPLLNNYLDSNEAKAVLANMKPNCAVLGNADSCNTKNLRLVNEIDLADISFEWRCYYELGLFDTEVSGECKSCLSIQEEGCSGYGSFDTANTCQLNPCGFEPGCQFKDRLIYTTCTER